MAEFGMKVFVNLVLKNLQQVQAQVQKSLGAAGVSGGSSQSGGILSGLEGHLKEINASIKSAESMEELTKLYREQAQIQKQIKITEKQGKGNGGILAILGTMLKALGPLAVLLSVKPIMDLIGVFVSFAFLGIILILKFLKWVWDSLVVLNDLVGQGLKNVWTIISAWIEHVWESIKVLPGKIWNFLKEGFIRVVNFLKELPVKIWAFIVGLPELIWTFMKEIPGLVWGFLKTGFRTVSTAIKVLLSWTKTLLKPVGDTLKNLWTWTKGVIGKIGKFFSELPAKIWTAIQTGFKWIKEKSQLIVDKLLALPGLIWEKMKQLGTILAKAIGSLWPFGGGGKSVDDALITSKGDVVNLNPNDNVLAFQGGLPTGGGTTINNFYGVTPQEMLDVIKRQLATESFNTSRF